MRRRHILPIVFGILTCTVVSTIGKSHSGHDEPDDTITIAFRDIKDAEKGCNLLAAKSCFLKMANATIMAIGEEKEKRKMYCKEVQEHYQCVQDSIENCSNDGMSWKGLAVVYPYVPLMKSMAYSACMDDSEDKKEEKGCDLEKAGACLMGFFHVAAETQTKATCWQSKQTASCLAAAMAHCPNKHMKNMESVITGQLRLTAEATCVKPGCNPKVALECLMSAKIITEQSNLWTKYKSPMLCGLYKSMLDCAVSQTQSCGKNVYEELSKGILLLHLGVKAMCSESMGYGKVPDSTVLQNLYNIKAIAASPFVSKDIICPLQSCQIMVSVADHEAIDRWLLWVLVESFKYYHAAKDILLSLSLHDFSLETIMKAKLVAEDLVGDYCEDQKKEEDKCVEMPPVCNKDMAKMCVKTSQMSYLIDNKDVLGKQTVCEEFHKLAMCVNSQISGCRMEELPDESFEFWNLFGVVADFCPLPSIVGRSSCNKRKCDISDALMGCFPMVKDEDIKSGNSCMHANHTLQCVRQHTDGCVMSLAMLPLVYTLHHYMTHLRPYCALPIMGQLNDGITQHSLLKDTWEFMNTLQYILTKSSNFNHDMCHILLHADKAIKKMKDVNPMIAYDLKKMHQLGTGLFEHFCKDYTEEQLKNMTKIDEAAVAAEPACGKDMAAYCLTMHYTRMTSRDILPVSEKHKVCYGYVGVKNCVMEHIANCSAKRQQVFKHAWTSIDILQIVNCPMDPHAAFLMMDMGSCAPETAKHCVDWMAKELAGSSAYNNKDTCKKFEQAMVCVHSTTKNCSIDKLGDVKKALMPLMKSAAPKCVKMMHESSCNATAAAVNIIEGLTEKNCYFDDAMDCIDFYNKAKVLWADKLEYKCKAAHKASMCAMYDVKHCSKENQTAVHDSWGILEGSFGDACNNLTSMNHSYNCSLLEHMPICSTNFDACFMEMSVSDICRNASAVKACMALHLRGCSPETILSTVHSMRYVSATFATTINATCDIIPKLPSNLVDVNYTANSSCLGASDIFSEYLHSSRAHVSGLCKAFNRISECLDEADSHMSLLSSAMKKLSKALKDVSHARCSLHKNLDLLYDKEMANTSVALNETCQASMAGLCVSDYIHSSLYSGFSALHDRKHLCESRYKAVQCIHWTTTKCPKWVRTRIETVMDWVNAVSSNIGACSMMEPRECSPHKALKCIRNLGYKYVKYGQTADNSFVCAQILPTKMCVMHATSSCEEAVRLNLEHSFADVADTVSKACEDMKHKKPKAMGTCNMKKAKSCMMSAFEQGWGLLKSSHNRSKACSHIAYLEKCVMENSAGCHDKEVLDSHWPLLTSLLTTVCFTGGERFLGIRNEEEWHCVTLAGGCIHDLLTVTMEGSVTGICSQLQPSMKCISSVMKKCSPQHKSLLKEAVQQFSMVGERLCTPTECNQALIMSCVNEADMYIKHAADKLVLHNDPLMCSALKASLVCLGNHTRRCKATEHPVLMDHIKAYRTIAAKFCPAETYNHLLISNPDHVTIFSLMAMASNPMVSKKDICPQAISMAKYIEHMKLYLSPTMLIGFEQELALPEKIIGEFCDKEDRNKKNMSLPETPKCNVTKAMNAVVHCMENNRLAFRIAASPYFGWPSVCHSANEMMCCLKKHFADGACSVMVVNMTLHAMQEVHSVVRKHCPLEQIHEHSVKHCPMTRKKHCRMHEAVKCLPHVTDTNKGEICSKWVDIMTCAEKNLEGCHSVEVTAWNFMIDRYYSWINCQTFAVQNTQIIINDSLSAVASCYRQLADTIHKELFTTSNFMASSCRAKKATYRCLTAVKNMPITMQYIFAATSKPAHPEIVNYCKKEKAGTCPTIPKDSAGICINNCTVDSDCEGQRKCCSNGCGHVCAIPDGVTVMKTQTEPSTCNVDKAATCFTTYMLRLANYRTSPLHERKQICSHIWQYSKCMHSALNSCSEERWAVFSEAEESLMLMHQEVCPPLTELVDDIEDICALPVARQCVSEFGKEVFKSPVNKNADLCKKGLKTMKCVYASTKNCSGDKGLALIEDMSPVLSFLGKSCPIASAIKCNSSLWTDLVKYAACNKTLAEHAYEHFAEVANDMSSNMSVICQTFESVTKYASINTMSCNPKELSSLNHTWSLMMSTTGKKCMESGYATKDFTDMITMYHQCEKAPICSTSLSHCLPESMNTKEICGNAEKIKKCMKEKLEGCDPSTTASVLGSTARYLQFYNLSCSIVPAMMHYDEEKNVTKVIEPVMDQCGMYLEVASSAYLHSNTEDDDQPICEMFHNFSMCLKSETSNMTGIWKGVFEQALSNVAMYTKTRCKLNEALKDMDKRKPNNTEMHSNYTWTEYPVCNQRYADMCVKYFMQSAIYGGLSPLGDRETMCKDRLQTYMCIKETTLYCSTKTRMKYLKMQEWISRLAMADGICPHLTEKGEVVPYEEAECDGHEAMECLHDLSLAITYYSLEHQSAVCSKLQPVASCVMRKTWGCSAPKRKMMENTYMDLAVMTYGLCYVNNERKSEMEIMPQCPGSMKDGKKTCNLPEAMFCVANGRSDIMGVQEESQVCKKLLHMKTCVMQHVSGCKPCQLEGIHSMMKMVKSKVNCPELECDVCGAATCVREFAMHAKTRTSSCVDIWKTKDCVKSKLKHCPHSNHTKRVTMEMESVMRSSKFKCDYPDATISLCAQHLATLAQKILGLGQKVKHMFEMDKEDDDGNKNVTMTTRQPYTSTDRPDDGSSKATLSTRPGTDDTRTPPPTTQRTTTGGDDKDDDDKDEDDKATDKDSAFLKNMLKNLMGMKMDKTDCSKQEPELDMNDMATMCHYAEISWQCVKGKLHEVTEDKSKAAISALLPIVYEAVAAKCMDVLHKEPLTCYACKGAKSNRECNMQPRQTCYGERQMCMTMIEEGVISKGCTQRMPLLSTSECVSGGKKCIHTCDTSDCNWPHNKAVTEGKYCNKKAAMVCALSLIRDLRKKQQPDCSKIKAAMTCIYMQTKHCLTHRAAMMHHYAYKFLHSPMMMKCAMEDLNCRCGSCTAVSLSKMLHNKYMTKEEKCMTAGMKKKSIMMSMMMEDCSVEDLYRLHQDAHLIKSVMGHSCPSKKMIPDDANKDQSFLSPVCDLEGVRTCFEESQLENLHRLYVHIHDKEYFCSVAKKMMLCTYWYTAKCDADVVDKGINASKKEKLIMLMKTCGFVDISPNFHGIISKIAMKTSENMKDIVGKLQGQYDDRAHLMAMVMYTMNHGEHNTYCKPTLALSHCFEPMWKADSAQFCESANKTHDCLKMFTHGCLWIQKAQLVYLFRMTVSKDAQNCGHRFNGTEVEGLSEKERKDPYYQLAQCSAKFTLAMHEAYVNPNANFSNTLCYASHSFDMCIHRPNLSPVGKTYLTAMTLFSQHMIEATCASKIHMPKNCSTDDKLCSTWQYLQFMFKDEQKWWESRETSSECQPFSASLCMGTHVMRLLGSAFSSPDQFDKVCWSQSQLMPCVDKYIAKCSEPRKNAFHTAASLISKLTKEACGSVEEMPTNCSIAEYCVDHVMLYSVSKEAYMNPMHLCWELDKSLPCVEYHAFNCTAARMKNVRQGLQLVGNLTAMYCPSRSHAVCELTKMQAPDPSKTCNMDKLRQCVTSYYDTVYDKELTKDVYCPVLQTAKTCISTNIVNCQQYVHKDIMDLMMPGIYQYYSYNCSAQQMVDYDKYCPIKKDVCDLAQASQMLLAMASDITTQMTSGTSHDTVCSAVKSTHIARLVSLTQKCSSTEVTFVNYEIDFITNATGLNCQSPLSVLTGALDDYSSQDMNNCIYNFGKAMEKTVLKPKYGFYDFCLPMQAFNNCMVATLTAETMPVNTLVGHLLESNRKKLTDFYDMNCKSIEESKLMRLDPVDEEPSCDVNTAYGCVSYYSLRAVVMPILPGQFESLCNETEFVHKCVREATDKCSSSVIKQQLHSLMFFHESMVMSSGMCDRRVLMKWHQNVARMVTGGEFMDDKGMLKVMKGQMGIMQKVIIDGAKAFAAGAMNTTKDDRKDKEKKDVCKPRLAMQCVLEASHRITGEQIMMNRSHSCRALEGIGHCMTPYLKACDYMIHVDFGHKFWELHKMYTIFCQKDKPEDKSMYQMDWMDTTYASGARGNAKWIDTTRVFKASSAIETSKVVEEMRSFMSMNVASHSKTWSKEDVLDMIAKEVAMSDPMCVSVHKYMKYGTCNVDLAMKSYSALFNVTMDPYSTHNQICMTHAVAVRMLLLSGYNCRQYAVKDMMHQMYMLVTNRIGDKCPTVVKEKCEEKKCDVEDMYMCYAGVKHQVEAAMKGQVKASEKVCNELSTAVKCAEEKSKHCDYHVTYQVHDAMQPGLETLAQLCTKLPPKICITNAMWKIAAIALMDKQMYEMGGIIKYMKNNNMSGNDDNKHDDKDHNVDMKQEELSQAVATLQSLLGGKAECMRDMYNNDGLVTGFMHLVRYAFMFNNVVPKSKPFMNMMTVALMKEVRMSLGDQFGGDIGSDMGSLIRSLMERIKKGDMEGKNTTGNTPHNRNSTSNHSNSVNMTGIGMEQLVGKLITQLIISGDSEKFIDHAVHKVAAAKMKWAIDRMSKAEMNLKGDGKKDEDHDKEEEDKKEDDGDDKDDKKDDDYKDDKKDDDYKDDKKDDDKSMDMSDIESQIRIVMESVTSVVKYERAKMTRAQTLHVLHYGMEQLQLRKASVCMDLMKTYYCAQGTLHLLPESTRHAVNATVLGLFNIAKQMCLPQKCYSCHGFYDNQKCNEQGMETCGEGQMCYTYIDNNKIYKGCSYMKEMKFNDTKKMGEICYGEKCNQNKYGALREPETCNLGLTFYCMYEILPILLQGQYPDERSTGKVLVCMETSTSHCIMQEHREIGQMAMAIKKNVFKQCSGPVNEYTCGLRNVIALASMVDNLAMDRETICRTLNDTMNVVKDGKYYKYCTEHEMLLAYQGLKLIYSIVGVERCPGISPKDQRICMAEMSKMKPMCEVNKLPQCLGPITLMKSYWELLGDADNMRDLDYMCSLVAEALDCMKKMTATCSDAQKPQIHKFIEEHLGQFMSHCPAINFMIDLCGENETESNCKVSDAIMTCLKPEEIQKNPEVLCSMDAAMLNQSIECLKAHTTQCTAVQGLLPISYVMQSYVTTAILMCGRHSLAPVARSGKWSKDLLVVQELLMHGLTSLGLDVPFGGTDRMPITQMGSMLMKLKYKNTVIGNLTQHVMNMVKGKENGSNEDVVNMLHVSAYMTKAVAGRHMSKLMLMDETHGVARCTAEYASYFQRALMYPQTIQVVLCEALHNAEICLRKLDVSYVTHVFVSPILKNVANGKELMCATYLDHVTWIGQTIANKTKETRELMNQTTTRLTSEQKEMVNLLRQIMKTASMNMSMESLSNDQIVTLLNAVMGQFMNTISQDDAKCNRWLISKTLTMSVIRTMIGGFNRFSEYHSICRELQSLSSKLKPEIQKCSNESQAVYNSVVNVVQNTYGDMCAGSYPVTECHSDIALTCLKDLMPYLSTVGTPRETLCNHVSMSLLCVSLTSRKCSGEKAAAVKSTQDLIFSTMGNRCPYITAAFQCENMANDDLPEKCNVSLATEKCVAMVSDAADSEKCGKLPAMMKCLHDHTTGCSSIEAFDAFNTIRVALMPVLKECYQDDKINIFTKNKACAAPKNKCSLKTAINCALAASSETECSKVTLAKSCVEENIKGCSVPQRMILISPLMLMKQQTRNCFNLGVGLDAYNQGVTLAWGTCFGEYVSSLTMAMSSPVSAQNNICNAFEKVKNCLFGNLTESDVNFIVSLMGTAMNTTAEVVKSMCFSDTTTNVIKGMIDSHQNEEPFPGCNIPAAAACLSSYSLPVMLSGVMTKEDKDSFCDPKGVAKPLVDCIYTNTIACPSNSTAILPLSAVGTAVHASKDFSGACSKELWVCSKKDALQCGVVATDKAMTNMTHHNWKERMCSYWDEYHMCLRRNTWGCDHETQHTMVKAALEKTFCMGFDMFVNCPSFKKAMSMNYAMLPKCPHQSKLNQSATCDIEDVFMCLKKLKFSLTEPTMDCPMLHSTYVNAMKCIHFHGAKCNKGQTMVITALVYEVGSKTYQRCPQVIMQPCLEDRTCRMDEARHCVHILEHLYRIPNFGRSHKCLSKEMAKVCVTEKLRNCSMFGQGLIVDTLHNMIPDKNADCNNDLGTCTHKLLQSAAGIVFQDVFMAELSRVKGHVTYTVTSHFMEKPGQVSWEAVQKKVNEAMEKMSNETKAEFQTLAAMSMLPKELMMQDKNNEYLADATMYMWNMITGGSDEHHDILHAKSKVFQCAALEEAYKCVTSKKMASQWAYLPHSHQEFVMQNIRILYSIAKDICPKQMTCTFMNEPPTCKLVPVLYAGMNQLTTVMIPNSTEKFCKTIPISIEFIKNSTVTCTSEVRPFIDSLIKIQETARDSTICHLKETCRKELAEKCLSDFKAALSTDARCNKYEEARSCLVSAMQGCSASDISIWTSQLAAMYATISASCQNIPDFEMPDTNRMLAVQEGQTMSIPMSLEKAPACGNDCEIRVSVSIKHDQNTPKCSGKPYTQLKVRQSGSASSCSMVFNDQNWHKNQTITLIPTVDGKDDKTQVVDVSVVASQYRGDTKTLTRNVADLSVSILDTETRWCTVTQRAGITSFDDLYHRNILQGMYTVYKHRSQPFEVFAYNQIQGGTIVMCGAVIKFGDDVMLINRCKLKGRGAVSLLMILYRTGSITPGTHIYEKNDKITVILPLGTRVNVKPARRQGLLITIASSANDKSQTTGLCGVYNGNKYDDAILRSDQVLKIENVNDFPTRALDQSWMTDGVILEMYTPPTTTYCSCGASAAGVTEDCGQGNVETCTLVQGIGVDVTTKFMNSAVVLGGQTRRRRQTDLLNIGQDIATDPNYEPKEPEWKDWTFESASKYCKDLFDNNAKIQACKDLPDSNSNDYTTGETECVNIIKSDNSADNTSTAVDTVLAKCELNAAQSGTDTVLNKLCENDCSGNTKGQCKQGVCLCYQGWLGSDCSISESTPPTISQLANYGKCEFDVKNNCKTVVLIGEDFVDKNLQCHFQPLQVDDSSATPAGVEKTSVGVYESRSQVMCTVPDAMATSSLKWGVRVAVSNGGQRKSAWSNVIAFNSVCYDCSNIACPMKTSGCLISGVCYASHIHDANDECQFCDPISSQTEWTRKISGTKCPAPTQAPTPTVKPTDEKTTPPPMNQDTTLPPDQKTSEQDDDLIVVVVVGCLCGVFVISTCVLAVKLCLKQPDSLKGSKQGSSPGTSIEGNPREFDNLAYDNYGQKPKEGLAAVLPTSTFGGGVEAYPQNIVDMGAMDDDSATKL